MALPEESLGLLLRRSHDQQVPLQEGTVRAARRMEPETASWEPLGAPGYSEDEKPGGIGWEGWKHRGARFELEAGG